MTHGKPAKAVFLNLRQVQERILPGLTIHSVVGLANRGQLPGLTSLGPRRKRLVNVDVLLSRLRSATAPCYITPQQLDRVARASVLGNETP